MVRSSCFAHEDRRWLEAKLEDGCRSSSRSRVIITTSSPNIYSSPAHAFMSGTHRSSLSFSSLPDNEPRLSGEGRRSLDLPLNSDHSEPNGVNSSDESGDPVQRLERELNRTREEKETLATQYRNLLAKLTQMRTSLGNKLQQDAVSSIR